MFKTSFERLATPGEIHLVGRASIGDIRSRGEGLGDAVERQALIARVDRHQGRALRATAGICANGYRTPALARATRHVARPRTPLTYTV